MKTRLYLTGGAMGNLGVSELLLILAFGIFFLLILFVWPYWRIFKKAGFSPALSLLMLVPLANIVMVFFLAFADWPALKQSDLHVG
jgi:type VI protein secretion system component VasK